MLIEKQSAWFLCFLAATLGSMSVAAEPPDLQDVARNLVQSARVTTGDKVVVTGSVRDAALMEHVAIETMKVGGQPLIVLNSDQLSRRSFDEVPEKYDTNEPALDLMLVNAADVQIAIEVGETEGLFAGVPQARLTARAKAYEPVIEAVLRRNVRLVSLGNGLYPTAALSQRLGISQPELGSTFWEAASVPPDALRAKGAALRDVIAKAKNLTITHPNGTNVSFAVDAGRGFVSDGAISADQVKQGGAAVQTWLPAGELVLPATAGTASGTVVVDKVLWRGKEIRDLTLAYSKGRLTSMTAASNLEGLKEAYDGAGGAKDQFGFIDIGLNPKAKLPLGTGRIIWMAPGAITLGLGDNRAFGGTNASEFALATQLGGATLKADGVTVIENGNLR